MPFDCEPTTLQPGYRPGERKIGAEVEVFNSDLLNAHLADLAIDTAPADLTTLSYEAVNTLCCAYLSRCTKRHDLTEFGRRVCAERASRPEYRAAYRAVA